MRVAVLAREGLFARLLADRLAEQVQVEAFVLERGGRARRAKLRREFRRSGALELLRNLLALRSYQGAWSRYLAGRPELGHEFRVEPTLVVDGVNDPEAAGHVVQADVDAVFVLGTEIIRGDTLDRLPRPVLNLHGGIVPRYRNVHSEVWAVLEGDIENVGSSLLHLDEGIDAGAVAGMARVTPGQEDGFFDLRLRNHLVAIDMAVDAARRLAAGESLPAQPQDTEEAKMYPTPGWREIRRLRRITDDFRRVPH